MSFSSSDINSVVRRGIGPHDPRFAGALLEHRKARRSSVNDDLARNVLRDARAVESFETARDWLAARPGVQAPVWLGHLPKTTEYVRGTRSFVSFEKRLNHEAMVFEVHGKRFQRLA